MIPKEQPQFEIIITREQIANRVGELAQKICQDYQGKDLVVVPLLTGAYVFAADLTRAMWDQGLTDAEIDFLGLTSYGISNQSSGNPQLTKPVVAPLNGRHVLIIEDVADTCHSIQTARAYIEGKNPASVATVVLVSKPSKHEVEVPIEYVGFTIGDEWIEGYGLDTAQKGRGRPDIIKKLLDKPNQ